MTRPLCPGFLMTYALALVDDAGAIKGAPDAEPAEKGKAKYPVDGGWSASFVHRAGYWSHFDHRSGNSVWPLPDTASCTELAAFAAEHGVLAADWAQHGDVYLLW